MFFISFPDLSPPVVEELPAALSSLGEEARVIAQEATQEQQVSLEFIRSWGLRSRIVGGIQECHSVIQRNSSNHPWSGTCVLRTCFASTFVSRTVRFSQQHVV